jgi:hypothetical protein
MGHRSIIHRSSTETSNRESIKKAFASVAYLRGALKHEGEKKGVWHTFIKQNETSPWERRIVLGVKPEGAIIAKGPGSATRTMQRLSGKAKLDITEDTGAIDTIIRDSEINKKPFIRFVRDKTATAHNKNNNKTKQVFREGNITIKEENREEKPITRQSRPKYKHEIINRIKPREMNLGAGVVQEGRRGRRHIKL